MKTGWPKHKEKCGIYAIENMDNGKCYIGQSQNIRVRWNNHLRQLLAGTHCNPRMQNAWLKHTVSAFRFILLEECEVSELNAREQEWINQLNAAQDGYNLSPTAGSVRGHRFSAEARARVSAGIKKAYLDPILRAKASQIRRENWLDPELRARMTEANRKSMDNPATKALISAISKKAMANDAARDRLSLKVEESWRDPVIREKQAAAIRRARRASSQIDERIAEQIRSRYTPHCKVNGGSAMAKEFGVSIPTISDIVAGRTWASATSPIVTPRVRDRRKRHPIPSANDLRASLLGK